MNLSQKCWKESQTTEIDTDDYRFLVVESEFARILAMSKRDGNILSQTIRDGWDNEILRITTRMEKLGTVKNSFLNMNIYKE